MSVGDCLKCRYDVGTDSKLVSFLVLFTSYLVLIVILFGGGGFEGKIGMTSSMSGVQRET